MRLKTKDYLGLFSRPDGFVKLLPWLRHESGLWILHDGSLGAAWKLRPVEAEAMSSEAMGEIYSNFELALLSLPWDGSISAQMVATVKGIEDDDPRLREYLRAEKGVPSLAREMGKAAVDRFLEGRDRYWPDSPFRSRRLSLIFCLRFHPPRFAGGVDIHEMVEMFKRALGKGRSLRPEARRYKELLEKAYPLVEAFENNLAVPGGLSPTLEPLSPEEMAEHLWERLNPSLAAAGVPLPDMRGADATFRSLVAATEPIMEPAGLDLDGWKARALSFKMLPESSQEEMFNALLGCGEDLFYSVGFLLTDKMSEIRRLEMKRRMAFTQLTTTLGDVNISQEVLKENLDELIRRLHDGRIAVAKTTPVVAITRPSEIDARRSLDKVATVLGRVQGAAAWIERHVGAAAWLSSLPLAFNPEAEKLLRRDWSIPSDNLVHFLPLSGCWKGAKKPLSLFHNRDGDPAFFNPTEANVGHTVVAAQTGAGKSFLVNRVLMDLMRQGARIFVIDIGGSYRRLCRLVGGRYMELTLDNPLVINPLAVDQANDETLGMLVRVILRLSRGEEKNFRGQREDETTVEKALRSAFTKKGWKINGRGKGDEVFLHDVVEILEKRGPQAKALAERLYKFHGDGRFARFFDRPDQLDLKKERFAVFDLKGLDQHADLQGALLLALMGKVARTMAALPQETRKVLVSDEAWALLNDPDSAAYFEMFSRTARKTNGMLVSISQSFLDWLDNPAGKVILNNSPTKVYLFQPHETLRQVARHFGLSEEDTRSIAGLHTIKGRYSEFFVTTPTGKGVLRYVPSPFEYWVFTTDPADLAQMEKALLEHEGDTMKAVRACAAEFPFGVAAGRVKKGRKKK